MKKENEDDDKLGFEFKTVQRDQAGKKDRDDKSEQESELPEEEQKEAEPTFERVYKPICDEDVAMAKEALM